MAIPFLTILPILGGIGKHILEVPIIHKWIENYCDSTPTIWDGILWKALEAAAGIASPVEREAVVVETAAKVQTAYDDVKRSAVRGETVSGATIQAAVRDAGIDVDIQELLGNG